MHAVQPQHLVKSRVVRLLRGEQAGGVVARRFRRSNTALDGADVLVGHEDAQRLHALGVVRADGREDDVEEVRPRRPHPQERLGRDDDGADIERGADRAGDPVLLELDQCQQRVEDLVFVDRGNAQAGG